MFKKSLSCFLIICFVTTLIGPKAHASVLGLPAPGAMVNLSPAFEPAMLKGVTVHKDNPFLFDFIVDVGQDKLTGAPLKEEGEKLIKYFMAGLTIPEKDLWVNLSPYEKDKITTDALGQTELGRDLLAQDYLLKQITASLIYPEDQLGKKFWDRVYAKSQQMFGTTEIPINTFNKVWIMADKAEVFERNQTAFVVGQHLKVMLEEDYLALQKNTKPGTASDSSNVSAQIVREIVLPELEKEVNSGKNFANLRQIFNSIILASWYKNNLKQSVLNQAYSGQSSVKGIDLEDPTVKQKIYDQYLAAYKKGVFNLVKEDSATSAARKYFSGGMRPGAASNPAMSTDAALLAKSLPINRAMVSFETGLNADAAIIVHEIMRNRDDNKHVFNENVNLSVDWFTSDHFDHVFFQHNSEGKKYDPIGIMIDKEGSRIFAADNFAVIFKGPRTQGLDIYWVQENSLHKVNLRTLKSIPDDVKYDLFSNGKINKLQDVTVTAEGIVRLVYKDKTIAEFSLEAMDREIRVSKEYVMRKNAKFWYQNHDAAMNVALDNFLKGHPGRPTDEAMVTEVSKFIGDLKKIPQEYLSSLVEEKAWALTKSQKDQLLRMLNAIRGLNETDEARLLDVLREQGYTMAEFEALVDNLTTYFSNLKATDGLTVNIEALKKDYLHKALWSLGLFLVMENAFIVSKNESVKDVLRVAMLGGGLASIIYFFHYFLTDESQTLSRQDFARMAGEFIMQTPYVQIRGASIKQVKEVLTKEMMDWLNDKKFIRGSALKTVSDEMLKFVNIKESTKVSEKGRYYIDAAPMNRESVDAAMNVSANFKPMTLELNIDKAENLGVVDNKQFEEIPIQLSKSRPKIDRLLGEQPPSYEKASVVTALFGPSARSRVIALYTKRQDKNPSHLIGLDGSAVFWGHKYITAKGEKGRWTLSFSHFDNIVPMINKSTRTLVLTRTADSAMLSAYQLLLGVHFLSMGVLASAIAKSHGELMSGKNATTIEEKRKYYKLFKNDIYHIIGALTTLTSGLGLAAMSKTNIDVAPWLAGLIGITGSMIGGGITGFGPFAKELYQASLDAQDINDPKLRNLENFIGNPYRKLFYYSQWPVFVFLTYLGYYKPVPSFWPVEKLHNFLQNSHVSFQYILPATTLAAGALTGIALSKLFTKTNPQTGVGKFDINDFAMSVEEIRQKNDYQINRGIILSRTGFTTGLINNTDLDGLIFYNIYQSRKPNIGELIDKATARVFGVDEKLAIIFKGRNSQGLAFYWSPDQYSLHKVNLRKLKSIPQIVQNKLFGLENRITKIKDIEIKGGQLILVFEDLLVIALPLNDIQKELASEVEYGSLENAKSWYQNHDAAMRSVSLRNGSTEKGELVAITSLALRGLPRETLVEFREVIRNPNFKISDKSRRILKDKALMENNGSVQSSIKNVVLSAVQDEGEDTKLVNPLKPVDEAMVHTRGGIDLNTASGMQWKVTQDSQGVDMTIDPALIEKYKREGIKQLSPVIFRITPVVSIWPLVGLKEPTESELLAGV
jgi:hypothetical protein